MILASVDIGTNTLRLLIADCGPDSFREIYSDRKITRLGERLDQTGVLSPEARKRSIRVLADFNKSIKMHRVAATAVVGTSALRNAANAGTFRSEVSARAGLDIQVITGEEEARLTLLGSVKVLNTCQGAPVSGVLIDIGGGSTEIIMTGRDATPKETSVPLGAVYLTERFIRHDPPDAEELENLRAGIRRVLDKDVNQAIPPGSSLVGTAGTITTLAAVDLRLAEYDPDKINCSVLTREAIDSIIRRLSVLTIDQRKEIIGLEQGREDIILAGAVVCREIMEKFNFRSLVVTDWGLREGIIFDLYDRMGKNTGNREGAR